MRGGFPNITGNCHHLFCIDIINDYFVVNASINNAKFAICYFRIFAILQYVNGISFLCVSSNADTSLIHPLNKSRCCPLPVAFCSILPYG